MNLVQAFTAKLDPDSPWPAAESGPGNQGPGEAGVSDLSWTPHDISSNPLHACDSAGDLFLNHAPNPKALTVFAHQVAEQTLRELEQGGHLTAASSATLMGEYFRLLQTRAEDTPIPDMLAFTAQRDRNFEFDERELSEIDDNCGLILQASWCRRLVRCPFLHLTRTPGIYRTLPAIFEFCRLLAVPIVQAHEKELITLATINPVTGSRALEAIAQFVEDETGRRPIPSLVIAPARVWRQLVRKHFGT